MSNKNGNENLPGITPEMVLAANQEGIDIKNCTMEQFQKVLRRVALNRQHPKWRDADPEHQYVFEQRFPSRPRRQR